MDTIENRINIITKTYTSISIVTRWRIASIMPLRWTSTSHCVIHSSIDIYSFQKWVWAKKRKWVWYWTPTDWGLCTSSIGAVIAFILFFRRKHQHNNSVIGINNINNNTEDVTPPFKDSSSWRGKVELGIVSESIQSRWKDQCQNNSIMLKSRIYST